MFYSFNQATAVRSFRCSDSSKCPRQSRHCESSSANTTRFRRNVYQITLLEVNTILQVCLFGCRHTGKNIFYSNRFATNFQIDKIAATNFWLCNLCLYVKLCSLERNSWNFFIISNLQVLQNVDELFEREELSAAPDAGWPDCFNSGVFVFRPSEETYQSLLQFAVSQGSFDGKTVILQMNWRKPCWHTG